jgi:hypothetical protein
LTTHRKENEDRERAVRMAEVARLAAAAVGDLAAPSLAVVEEQENLQDCCSVKEEHWDHREVFEEPTAVVPMLLTAAES